MTKPGTRRSAATPSGPDKPKGNKSNIMARYSFIIIGFILFGCAIAYQLFNTTMVHAADWNAKANAELAKSDTILPQRGDILAADGSILVTNLTYYNIRIDYRSEAFAEAEYLRQLPALCDSLAKHFPRYSRTEWEERLRAPMQPEHDERTRSFPLLVRLTHPQKELVRSFPFFNLGSVGKTGWTEEEVNRRDCPYGDMARRSIGRVGQTAQSKEIHGISGLEKALDSLLYGQIGYYKRVPFTRHIGNWTDIPAVPGYNVRTTIDIGMQDILENELNAILDSCGAEWGTAILMETATGDIKAISNFELDPASGRYIEAYNRATVAYEPGSVVKPISMMIALEDGLVNNLDEVIPIGQSFAYGGGKAIKDSHYNSALTVSGIIEQSSNIGMTRVIIRGYNDNPKGFVDRLRDIGFFEPMNTGIADEERPRMSQNPTRLDLSRMSYGYSTAIPPLYTLSVYNAIANGGRYVRPRLVCGLQRDGIDSVIPVSYIRDRICSEENAAKMRLMLTQVTEGAHGTGRRLKNPYVSIAGKTGTCYSINYSTGQYETGKKRLAFCGFFPADQPKYSCMVLIYHPTKNMFGAASTSGEVLKNVALKLYSRGMLGHTSDYTADAPADPGHPYIAAGTQELTGHLGPFLGNTTVTPYRLPEGNDDHGVPRVNGLPLRRAIALLEDAGLDVTFEGEGIVRSQSLQPGGTVHLRLRNT